MVLKIDWDKVNKVIEQEKIKEKEQQKKDDKIKKMTKKAMKR